MAFFANLSFCLHQTLRPLNIDGIVCQPQRTRLAAQFQVFDATAALTQRSCSVLCAQHLRSMPCVESAGILEGSGKTEAVAKRLIAERRWRLAMHSYSHPSSIMRDVLACLQHNQVSWKKQAPYNLKCRKAIGAGGMQAPVHSLPAGPHSRLLTSAGTAAASASEQVLHQ